LSLESFIYHVPYKNLNTHTKLQIKLHKIIILSVVLYGCVTWTKVRVELSLRVFENRVISRISGPKGEGAAVGCRDYCGLKLLTSIIKTGQQN
jgi:hypothetical protein